MTEKYWMLLLGAVIMGIVIRVFHKTKRLFENRCTEPGCGGLFMDVTYYMEVNQNAPYNVYGHLCTTYKFLTCRRRGHLRSEVRERIVSDFALDWKKSFTNHFDNTEKVRELMRKAGFGPEINGTNGTSELTRKPHIHPDLPADPVRFPKPKCSHVPGILIPGLGHRKLG